jgi:hypothetical protein
MIWFTADTRFADHYSQPFRFFRRNRKHHLLREMAKTGKGRCPTWHPRTGVSVKNGIISSLSSAAAVVLLSAGWAAAEPPARPAIDLCDYARPALDVPVPIRTVVDVPVPITPPPTPAYPWPGSVFDSVGCNCPPPYIFWGSADFLVWKIHSGTLPALTATVPAGVLEFTTFDTFQTPQGRPTSPPQPVVNVAALSLEPTSVPATGNRLSVGDQYGGRFTAGVWLGDDQSLGLEATGFFLNNRTAGFTSTTGNSVNEAIIQLPGSNNHFIVTGATPTLFQSEAAFLVRQAAATLVGGESNGLWGAEVNARAASASFGAVSGFVGFRYLEYHENLEIHDTVQLALPTGAVSGNVFNLNLPGTIEASTADRIHTRNQFYGGQVGLDLDTFVRRVIFDVRAQVALGVMHQSAEVGGATVQPNGAVVPGGLLSGPLDAGTHHRNEISWVPEIDLKLGYMITPYIRAYVSYDFLYLFNVLRAGEQSGTQTSGVTVAVAGVPSPITVTTPAFRFKDSDVWVQGINVGMEIRY